MPSTRGVANKKDPWVGTIGAIFSKML
uniref:Uncharacterized protein n=1 Tax=Arundo donax TaxID=35708 RepID=A0A0A8Y9E8_ARUDO